MRRYKHIGTSLIVAFCLLALQVFPALAQLGIGIGGGSWGRWGSYGGPFFWVEFWPGLYQPRATKKVERPKQPISQTGILEGRVTLDSVCPVQSQKTCPATSEAMNAMTVIATPIGTNQWIATKPTTQGDYRLLLPPGSYNVQLQHPYLNLQPKSHQVLIQPGQALRLNVGTHTYQ